MHNTLSDPPHNFIIQKVNHKKEGKPNKASRNHASQQGDTGVFNQVVISQIGNVCGTSTRLSGELLLQQPIPSITTKKVVRCRTA
jgi:hypothetical protein